MPLMVLLRVARPQPSFSSYPLGIFCAGSERSVWSDRGVCALSPAGDAPERHCANNLPQERGLRAGARRLPWEGSGARDPLLSRIPWDPISTGRDGPASTDDRTGTNQTDPRAFLPSASSCEVPAAVPLTVNISLAAVPQLEAASTAC